LQGILDFIIFAPNIFYINKYIIGMKRKEIIVGSVLLAASVVIFGFLIKSSIIELRESQRTVTVRGLSEREVDADKVIWPLTYRIVGNDLPTLYRTMEEYNTTIIGFLAGFEIPQADISVAIPTVADLRTDQWRSQSDIRYRYNISSAITVSSRDVERVRKAMDNISELFKKGIAVSSSEFGNSQIQFLFTSLNDVRPEMIEEATRSARQAAEKFAEDSGSKLGKIRRATQGQFSITIPDSNTPYKQQVRVVTTVEYSLRD